MPERLTAAIEGGQARGVHAVVVVRHGRLVVEHYGTGNDYRLAEPLGQVAFRRETLHDVRSVTKSVVGVLYGIALAAGDVPEPDAPLLESFTEYPDLQADPRRAGLRVAHALTMTCGLEWNEHAPYTSEENSEIAMEFAPDRYRYALERPLVAEPGTTWRYSGGAAAIVGRLIAKGTAASLPDFTRETLCAPLGITDFDWITGADGDALAASGLRLTASDLARIGQLVLDHGRFADQQVVPASWVDAMLQPHAEVSQGLFYGYLWYVGATDVDAGTVRWVGGFGNGGQRLYVCPGLDLVVAISAGNYDVPEQWIPPTVVFEQVVLGSLAR
ncbi:MAG: serine hydrolase [Jiangellaceae bacterium]|nr:serine hydrolase [Jiangellaceae bacterium]